MKRYEFVGPVINSENYELAHTIIIYQKPNIILVGNHPEDKLEYERKPKWGILLYDLVLAVFKIIFDYVL